MRRAIIMLLCSAALAAAGCSSSGGQPDPAAAARISEALTRTVTYEVYLDPQRDEVLETEVMTADLTLSEPGGTSQTSTSVKMADVAGKVPTPYLAYTDHVDLPAGSMPYISAQNTTGYGAVTCKIKTGDETIASVTSDSEYGIATCTA